VKDSSQSLLELTASQREAVVRKWLAHTSSSYPDQTTRFLLDTQDPFRNPVGSALKKGLPVLFDQLAGEFSMEQIAPALDDIVRIRAVQDFSASQAVGFIFHLKEITREELGPETPGLAALDKRIDRLAQAAFDIYMECREKTWRIQVREAKRRVYVLEQVASRRAHGSSTAPEETPRTLPAN
jgi:hypothetical protein